MNNTLQNRITFTSLIKYTLPTIIMMICFSLYTIIDGMFISRFVGADALSASNIVYPIIFLVLGVGTMFATGGSAIVARKLGENNVDEARENFTLITLGALMVGMIIEIITIIFMKKIIYLLGSTDALYFYCKEYLLYMILFTPFIILKFFFDYFLVTAGAAKLRLFSGLLGGVVNIILDYVFMVNINMGIKGAALATCIGYIVPSFIGIFYFLNKKHTLHFVKPKLTLNVLANCCSNGYSEMITQISNCVASITIILYIQMLLNAAYMGFISGVQPRISFNYGSKNSEQLKNIIKYSLMIIYIFALFTFSLSRQNANFLISIFTSKESSLFGITHNAFMIFSFGFLFNGINIFTSGMFTAFSNGKVSAIISSLRTFIFFIIGMMIFPNLFGVNGVWMVVPFAEIITLIVSLVYIYKYRKEYMYENIFTKESVAV